MKIKIGKKYIENGSMYIVAEISANHNGSINKAKKLIYYAKKSGADAVKIQSYSPDSMTINSNMKDFRITHPVWKKYKNFYNLYKKGQTPDNWIKELFNYAKKIKIDIFSTPFDENSIDELEKYNCVAYKIASPEINHLPLIEKAAKTKKPIIISTGVAKLEDIKLAINTIKKTGNNKIIILKCDSSYPAKFEDANLGAIPFFKKKFKSLVGYSDHTKDINTALLSYMYGGCFLERHFNINNNKKTLDSFFSSDFDNFKEMVHKIRHLEKKNFNYLLSKTASKSRSFMRSIYIQKNVKKNEKVSKSNIKVVRPAQGLHPKYYFKILGKTFKNNYKVGDRLSIKCIK